MLQDIFYWVFNMSITAALTGLLVMLIRQIKRIPRRLSVLLWMIPFLRMVLPLGLNSPYSLMSLLSRFATKTVVVYQPADGIAFSMMNCVVAADTYFPVTYKVDLLEKVFSVASVIWIAVFFAMILMLAFTYVTTLCEIRNSRHVRDNIYLSEKLETPAVYGIVKPRIILPAAYQNKDADLVILHEKTHIRGLDNLWRMMAMFIAAAHWFNPLCWLFLSCFLADLEMSCDERVLAKLGDDGAKAYALSLLESRENTAVFASAFGGVKLRPRIENILSFRKMTWLSLVAFLMLIGVIFYVLLTNAG